MQKILLILVTLLLALVADARPSAARPWYPWCAQFADRSGITSCQFMTFEQCRATVSGIGGGCIQNWYPPPGEPRYERRRRHRYY